MAQAKRGLGYTRNGQVYSIIAYLSRVGVVVATYTDKGVKLELTKEAKKHQKALVYSA